MPLVKKHGIAQNAWTPKAFICRCGLIQEAMIGSIFRLSRHLRRPRCTENESSGSWTWSCPFSSQSWPSGRPFCGPFEENRGYRWFVSAVNIWKWKSVSSIIPYAGRCGEDCERDAAQVTRKRPHHQSDARRHSTFFRRCGNRHPWQGDSKTYHL